MENLTKTASNAAATVKNAVFGSTSSDTDRTGHASSSAHRDTTGAPGSLTHDRNDFGTGAGKMNTHQAAGSGLGESSHNDFRGSTGTEHHHGLDPTTGSSNYGPHNSNVANKLDPTVDSDRDGRGLGSGSTGIGSSSTNYGPHNSNAANKLDPRVDSDRDGRGIGNTAGHSGIGSSSTNYGPHDSNAANKLDPRVDSDRDGRGIGNTAGHSGIGSSTTHGGIGSSSTNYGPHDSNVANKLDPRVDSDRDGRGIGNTAGQSGIGSSTTHGGIGSSSTNYGPHDSNAANKLDPRVDSDRDGRGIGNTTGHSGIGSTGTHGTANNGPHDSSIANKLDPRVDSDRDGRAGSLGHPGVNPPTKVGESKDFTRITAHGSGLGGGLGSALGGTTGSSRAVIADDNHRGLTGISNTEHGKKLEGSHNHTKSGLAGAAAGLGGAGLASGIGSSHGAGSTNNGLRDSSVSGSNGLTGVGSSTSGLGSSSHSTGTKLGGMGSSHAAGFGVNPSHTAGPHNSNIANKLDPRVDSDRDGRGLGHSTGGLTGTGQHAGGVHSGAGSTLNSTHMSGHTENYASPTMPGTFATTPVTETERSLGSNNQYASSITDRAELVPTTKTASTDEIRSGYTGTSGSTNDGPHNSNIANKLDPRVDSDRDGSHGTHHTTGVGAVGSSHTAANNGPHNSKIANKLDPRVDSDRDHREAHGSHGFHGSHPPLEELQHAPGPRGPIGSAVTMPDAPTQTSTIPTVGNTGGIGSVGPSNANVNTGHIGSNKASGFGIVNPASGTNMNAMAGSGPGTAMGASVGVPPTADNTAHSAVKHQGADQPLNAPGHSGHSTGAGHITHDNAAHPAHSGHAGSMGSEGSNKLPSGRRKSVPLVAPAGPGDAPSGPPRQQHEEGTGTKYVRSTGLAADGGNFDAAAPGAGREADRLLDEAGVHHGKEVGGHGQGHGSVPGEKHGGLKEKLHLGTGKHI